MGDLGVTYTVQLWLVGKRVEDFLLALIKLFSLALTLRRYEQILVEIALFDTVGSLWAQISGGGGVSTSCGVKKLDSLGYHVVLFP